MHLLKVFVSVEEILGGRKAKVILKNYSLPIGNYLPYYDFD